MLRHFLAWLHLVQPGSDMDKAERYWHESRKINTDLSLSHDPDTRKELLRGLDDALWPSEGEILEELQHRDKYKPREPETDGESDVNEKIALEVQQELQEVRVNHHTPGCND